MRGLQAGEIVDLWERMLAGPPPARALTLLVRATDESIETAARVPVGRRDAALVGLRRATFGDVAPCFVQCPDCAAELEFDVDLAALVVPVAPGGIEVHRMAHGSWVIDFRLPCTADLLDLIAHDHAAAVAGLLAACIVRAELAGDVVAADRLPADVADAVANEIARLDPHAEITFALRCDDCAHGWSAPFDIVAYLWREIEVEARRLLAEVDVLARLYGWSEAAILALSRARRRAYLELAGAT